jgi:5-methylcytosine-specific restriction endonuclease McrA
MKLYDRKRWNRIRRHQLRIEPLCRFCLERGIVTPATVADHIEPHRGDVNSFFLGKLQSLCATCHGGRKQEIEKKGFFRGCDFTGMPLDPNHPANRA